MKIRQLTARLVYASHLSSWRNIHPEMKPAVTGLLRRGFMERRKKDEALTLTSKGTEFLESQGIQLNPAKECADGTAEKLVPDADYWTDEWNQSIPK